MKVDVERRTEISKPVADVFRFIAIEHARNHARWDPAGLEVKQLDPGPVKVGTRFDYSRRAMGWHQVLRLVVTDMVPDRKFAFSVEGSWRGAIIYSMEPAGPSSTLLDFDGHMELGGPQLLSPLAKVAISSDIKGSQARIKRLVEGGG